MRGAGVVVVMTVVVGSDAALAGQEQAVQATTGIIQHHSTAAALHTQHLSLKLTHRRPESVAGARTFWLESV